MYHKDDRDYNDNYDPNIDDNAHVVDAEVAAARGDKQALLQILEGLMEDIETIDHKIMVMQSNIQILGSHLRKEIDAPSNPGTSSP